MLREPSKFFRHFENIMLAGSPKAVPTAFLTCQSSVCSSKSASSKSERVFSVVGNMVAPKKKRLAPQQV